MSYEQSRRSVNLSMDKILAECQRENSAMKDEQMRLNNQLRNIYMANQKLIQENQILLDENQELSDLCLYLDDERVRLLKVVEEWEKCGRYYWDKFNSDLSVCQERMTRLEAVENSLSKENKELKEVLTSSSGGGAGGEILRRGGDGSSSPSPSVEAEVRSKAQNSSSVMMSPSFSDSDDSSGRNNFDSKNLGLLQTKPNYHQSIAYNHPINTKPWSKSIQDIHASTTHHKLDSSTSTGRQPPLGTIAPPSSQHYSARSTSLNRPMGDSQAVHPPSAEIMYSHPFYKMPSNPIFYNKQQQIPILHHQQPIKTKMTSSSLTATDHQLPTSGAFNPYPSPSHQLSSSSLPLPTNQIFRHRSSSTTPSTFQPQMIGYYPVNGGDDDDRFGQKSNRRTSQYLKLKESAWKEQPSSASTNKSFNYKTSF